MFIGYLDLKYIVLLIRITRSSLNRVSKRFASRHFPDKFPAATDPKRQ